MLELLLFEIPECIQDLTNLTRYNPFTALQFTEVGSISGTIPSLCVCSNDIIYTI